MNRFRMRAALLAITLLAMAGGGQAACPDIANSLDQAVATTRSAVMGANSEALVAIFSPDGVVIGVDGPTIPYRELKRQFAAREGTYCDLFACGGKSGSLSGLFWGDNIVTQVESVNGKVAGLAQVSGRSTGSELELDYQLTAQCSWTLVAIVYT